MTRPGPAPWVATAAVAAFWVVTAVAGARFPAYAARDDVVSTLAGRGSPVAVLGVLAILLLALAHAAGAGALAAAGRVVEAWLLAGAALATVVVAGFRVSNGGADDGIDQVHVAGVVGYELLLLATMATVVLVGAHGQGWSRGQAVVAGVAAVVSLGLLVRWSGGGDAGLWQRVWLGADLGWLLLVSWTARRQDTGVSGWTATSPAR